MRDKVIAIDLEMPGQKIPRISAIGITLIEKGEITQRLYYLVNPETKFDKYVIKLVGITPEMVKDEPTFPEIWEKIKDIMNDGLLVAHGAPGDLKILCGCLRDYGIEWKDKVEFACTCDMGLEWYPHLEGHSLDYICDHIGCHFENHHNALADSEGCAKLFLHFLRSGMDIEKQVKVFDTVFCRKVRDEKGSKKKRSVETKVHNALLEMADEDYRKALLKKYPMAEPESIIGVSNKKLRRYAQKLFRDNKAGYYLKNPCHFCLEEKKLHALLISEMRKFSTVMNFVKNFLPFIDSVEVCDALAPKIFMSRQRELADFVDRLLLSRNKYDNILAINFINRFFAKQSYIKRWREKVLALEGDFETEMKKAEFLAKALIFDEKNTLTLFFEEGPAEALRGRALQLAAATEGVKNEKKLFYLSLMG